MKIRLKDKEAVLENTPNGYEVTVDSYAVIEIAGKSFHINEIDGGLKIVKTEAS